MVDIKFNDDYVHLTLGSGQGQRITELLLNQVEEAQMMDRDM